MTATSSSSSSSDEADVDDQKKSMKNLADLMWHKLKNDRFLINNDQTQRSESESKGIGARSECAQLSSGNTSAASSQLSSCNSSASSSQLSSSSRSASGSLKTVHGIRAIHQNSAQEALKAISSKVAGCVQSLRQRKKQARMERSQWNGQIGSWGALKMKEQTEDDKRNLMVLSMRSTIDPTRHYKHNDLKAPKFFQIGTVLENPVNFYHDRIPKKQRKRTLLDELMADDNFKKQTKKRYMEMLAAKAGRRGLHHNKASHKVLRHGNTSHKALRHGNTSHKALRHSKTSQKGRKNKKIN